MPNTIKHRLAVALVTLSLQTLAATVSADEEITFQRVPTQFIAALGEPSASSGTGAETWGLWQQDPGPRGVWLRQFPKLQALGGYGPGNWKFDDNDWWLDENGLIMEPPAFPIPPGQYLVTGEREVTTVLTVFPADHNGSQKWALGDDAELFDVTHMPCRSARYTPIDDTIVSCSPANADQSLFRVAPGTEMPAVPGCLKQDYSVLIVIGVAIDS